MVTRFRRHRLGVVMRESERERELFGSIGPTAYVAVDWMNEHWTGSQGEGEVRGL